jgi:hypothetical protein
MTRKEFISWAESCGYHIYDRQGDVFIYYAYHDCSTSARHIRVRQK